MKADRRQEQVVASAESMPGVVMPIVDKELRHDILSPLRRLQYAAQLLADDLVEADADEQNSSRSNDDSSVRLDKQHNVTCIQTIQRASQELTEFLSVHLAHVAMPVACSTHRTSDGNSGIDVNALEFLEVAELLRACGEQALIDACWPERLQSRVDKRACSDLGVRLRAAEERSWYLRLFTELGRLFLLSKIKIRNLEAAAAGSGCRIELEFISRESSTCFREESSIAASRSAVSICGTEGAGISGSEHAAELVAAGTETETETRSSGDPVLTVDSTFDNTITEVISSKAEGVGRIPADLSSSADRYALMNCSMLCELLQLGSLQINTLPGCRGRQVTITIVAQSLNP